MPDLKMVSLFAGIGGFEVAFERAEVHTVAAVEIDKSCREVLSRRFRGVTLFEDVTKVSGDDLRAVGFIPERGILTGGFPCQDISVAGRGAGLAGARSGLFWEVVRLLDDLQPKWFILENVPRLLTINEGRDMGTIAKALAECGYSLAWRVLDAQHFGVPQRRRRVFIVGCLGDSGRAPAEVLFEPEGGGGDSKEGDQAWSETSGTVIESPDSPSSAVTTHTHTHISTLQGGGKRGYRIDAEAAAGGHLIVELSTRQR